jgi:hypothetical protein
MRITRVRRSNIFRDDPPPAPQDPPPDPPVPPPPGKTFTQADVDRIVKADKDRAKRERDQLQQELQSLRDQGLTNDNLEQLNQRIEQLQNEGKTKEQLANEERGKLEKRLTGEIQKKENESKLWKSRYEGYRSKSEVLAAASRPESKAFNPEQVYQIIRNDIVMIEETGPDGKPTGEVVPRVKMRTKAEDGTEQLLELAVPDALKRMTDMEIHSNLFESGASNGVGGYNTSRTKGSGSTAIPTDTAAYMEARKKNPGLLRNVPK